MVFADPLQLIVGNAYRFSFFVNNCGSVSSGGCYEFGMLPGAVDRPPAIEITTSDAYAGGAFIEQYSESVPTGRDIRFEAVYIDEPPAVALLAIAASLGLAAALRRRRARAE